MIIFIGGGNIAEAIFTKLTPNEIIIIEHNDSRVHYLSTKYPDLTINRSLNHITHKNDLIVLAIKPQSAKKACFDIATKISASNVLSIMAGINTATLANWLNNDKISRAMPNTPGILNIGVTGLYFSDKIQDSIRIKITDLFKNIGLTYILDNEDSINKITAVASSAPAYIFYFIESLIDSAIKNFNFSEKEAREITLQVVKGSLAMLEKSPDLPIATLRKNVTSKGGTTAAAINIFEEHKVKELISQAELACYNRALELGNILDQ